MHIVSRIAYDLRKEVAGVERAYAYVATQRRTLVDNLNSSAHALTQTLQTHGLHVRHTTPAERKRFNVKTKRNIKTSNNTCDKNAEKLGYSFSFLRIPKGFDSYSCKSCRVGSLAGLMNREHFWKRADAFEQNPMAFPCVCSRKEPEKQNRPTVKKSVPDLGISA
jgi:hypothetical protein